MKQREPATAQAVVRWAHNSPEVVGAAIAGTDAELHRDWDTGIDWATVHEESVTGDETVPDMPGPYWVNGRPITCLAFWSTPERARIAADADTPRELAALLADDPDRTVAHLAAGRLLANARDLPSGRLAAHAAQPDVAGAPLELTGPSSSGRGAPFRPQRGKPVRTVLLALGILAATGGMMFALAMGTAVRWAAVDVPAEAETFRMEAYYTGNWIVCDGYDPIPKVYAKRKANITPGKAFGAKVTEPLTCANTATWPDSSKQLCRHGQDWTSCINEMVDEYNRECTRSPLTDGALSLCEDYGREIDRMKKEDEPGYIVETVGDGYGYLRSVADIDFRQVSNNDYRPAVTHEATCYLGVFGECPPPGTGIRDPLAVDGGE